MIREPVVVLCVEIETALSKSGPILFKTEGRARRELCRCEVVLQHVDN